MQNHKEESNTNHLEVRARAEQVLFFLALCIN